MSEPGTAAMVGWAALLHDVPPGHPVGGSGGLTDALRRRLESDGGRVVLGDGAAPAAGRGRPGHRGRDGLGTTDRAPTPSLAACHIGVTRALAGDAAPPALADADPPVGNGFGLVVRALTDAVPAIPGVPGALSSARAAAAVHRPRRPRRGARRLGGRPAAPRRRCRWR